MLEREIFIQELWKRLADVDDVVSTARNPKDPPNIGDLPCIHFFELGDRVISTSRRGASQYPVYTRVLSLVMEIFLVGVDEPSSTKSLIEIVKNTKIKVYADGNTLGKRCSEVREVDAGRILRPPVGGPVIGVGLAFEIQYVENISNLF